MKAVLPFLANPLYVGGLVFLFAISIGSQDLDPVEYLEVLPFLFLFFSLPFMLMSSFTHKRLGQTKEQIRLVGLWVGSLSASIIWVASIIFSNNAQAGLGFISMPLISTGGGIIGYLTFWFFNVLTHRSK